MSCECFKIGGPFIAEDPDCPMHGYEAQRREREAAAEREAQDEQQAKMLARIEALETQVQRLNHHLERVLEMVPNENEALNHSGERTNMVMRGKHA